MLNYEYTGKYFRKRSKFRSYGRFKIELISSTSNFLNEDGHLKVGYYITKSLSKDIDYDILIKY